MRIVPILLASLTLAGAAQAAELPEKLLAGRTAGEPVHCISRGRVLDTQTFDDGSIFYRMSEKHDYLQRPHGCTELTSNRSYVSVSPSTNLCQGDTIRIFDSAAHISYGACVFDDFVPYSKKPRAQ